MTAAAARIGPQSLDIVTMVESVNKPCGGAKRRRRRIWTKMRWKCEVEEAEEEYLGATARAPSSFNQTSKSATRSLLLIATVAIVASRVRWME